MTLGYLHTRAYGNLDRLRYTDAAASSRLHGLLNDALHLYFIDAIGYDEIFHVLNRLSAGKSDALEELFDYRRHELYRSSLNSPSNNGDRYP